MTIEVLKYTTTAIYCAIQYVTPKYHTPHFKNNKKQLALAACFAIC